MGTVGTDRGTAAYHGGEVIMQVRVTVFLMKSSMIAVPLVFLFAYAKTSGMPAKEEWHVATYWGCFIDS